MRLLGCISLVLCLLELPHGAALPRGRRAPPERSPSPASLLGDQPGLRPPAPPRPPGTSRHGLKFPSRLGARLAPRHRLLVPGVTPRRRLLVPGVAPRHRLLVPGFAPWRRPLVLGVAPRHRAVPPRLGAPRGRRQASGRGQLVRVGCVLGTCQVQNLSHRLWQLMGQSGRQDSSPMNPNSPHSYG